MNKLNHIHTVTVPVEIPRYLWDALISRYSGFSDWRKQNQSQTDLATDLFVVPMLHLFASAVTELLTQDQLDEISTVCPTSGRPLKSTHKGRFSRFQKQTAVVCVDTPPLKLRADSQLLGDLKRLAEERQKTVEDLISPFVTTCLRDLLEDVKIRDGL